MFRGESLGRGEKTLNREFQQDPSIVGLITRAQEGDVAAFEQLYRRHVGQIYGLCLRLVADPVQAEILTQDVFVRAWEKLGSYRVRGVFAGWLHRLAVNVVIEDRRQAARWARRVQPLVEKKSEGESNRESATRELDTTDFAESQVAPAPTEDLIDLDRAISALPLGARLAFVLHDVMGYPHAEIAAMTHSATGTIKAQVHRARSLLRRALGGTAGDNAAGVEEAGQ